MQVFFGMTCLLWIAESHSLNLNPFAGFTDFNYEPMSDFSVNQGIYLSNMPVASIYPLVNDENFNGMIGVPALKSANPFAGNPFLVSGLAMNPANGQRARNPSGKHRSPAKSPPSGVTLDVRGGGYKLEKAQQSRPYKAPSSEVRPRQNGERNVPQPRRPANRRPDQRQRGPNIKNPHYNIKFESSSPSVPSNIEFVNPENVLPLHPSVYKPFLQRNKHLGAYLQNMARPNRLKHGSAAFGFPNNLYASVKTAASQLIRGRHKPPTSNVPLVPASSFPGFPFVEGQLASQPFSPQLAMFSEQDKFTSPKFGTDIVSQDPYFLNALSQTPEGRQILNQLQQQAQAAKTVPSSHPIPYKAPAFADQQTSLSYASGMQTESPSYSSHVYNQNVAQTTQKTPNPAVDYQQMMQQYYQQPIKQSAKPYFVPTENPRYKQQQPQANPYQYATLPNQPPYADHQLKNGPQYQYMQDPPSYQEHVPQKQPPAAYSRPKTPTALSYTSPDYQTSLQASQKQVNSQIPDAPVYSPSSFVPVPEEETPSSYYAYELANKEKNKYQYSVAGGQYPQLPVAYQGPVSSHGYSGMPSDASPYLDEEAKSTGEYAKTSNGESSPSEQNSGYPSGYLTPEQLYAPQTTGIQSEAKFGYPSAQVSSSQVSSSSSHAATASKDATQEGQEGNDRAALHLSPAEMSVYVAQKEGDPFFYEYTEAYEPAAFYYPETAKPDSESEIQKEPGMTANASENMLSDEESEEIYRATIKDIQKLLSNQPTTKAPKRRKTLASTTTPQPELKNHRTTHSYMFQYSPVDKSNSKTPTTTWQAWKPNATRYQLPATSTSLQTPVAPTTTTTATTISTTTEPPTTTTQTSTPTDSLYHEGDTPICARHNNLTYCLQDPEYPKDEIKAAIERNRHPLDHFLVDISASSNIVDDSFNKVLENSVPLQSTSVSYSFEGNVIVPTEKEAGNATTCSSKVYYAKPLRAINTAGNWKIIVNVEFEESDANYTQTVRIEECTRTGGYLATCGAETISACLQQYKLYRLLAWEPNRGFYIDAFLLPISCFCGNQQPEKR